MLWTDEQTRDCGRVYFWTDKQNDFLLEHLLVAKYPYLHQSEQPNISIILTLIDEIGEHHAYHPQSGEDGGLQPMLDFREGLGRFGG